MPEIAGAPPPRQVGLLGGSFDPVHRAHLALAQQARQALGLDQVWWIPAGEPWQKAALGASAAHRLAMLQLALQHQPDMHILTLEVDRHGPTYTADTVRQLRNQHGSAVAFTWLLGSDQLRNFVTWMRWQDIVAEADLAVAMRPGHPAQVPAAVQASLAQHRRALRSIPFDPQDISATEIRRRIRAGQPFAHLVPAGVADYISHHQLYYTGPA